MGVAAAMALLAGCGAGATPEPEVEEPTVAAPTPTADVEESAAPATTGELSAPGTRLAIGEAGVVHRQAGAPGDEYFGYAVLETTVTEIERGDPAVFAVFENSDELTGLVPYYVRAEHVILSVEGKPNDLMVPSITGRYDDGTEARGAVSFGGGFRDVCGVDNFDELAVGQVATTCSVALAEENGRPVTGAQWIGDDRADGDRDANPYDDNPVVWGD